VVERDQGAEDSMRITQQFRSGEAMIYGLRSASNQVTVRVSGRGGEEAGPPAEWCIEALADGSRESVVVSRWGPTRTHALRAVGRWWKAKSPAHNLPAVDWSSVERAMDAVRAL
jgi:hypothetical protein